ncbi:TM0106 family RecB-like putative nuclease [Flavimobilis sp. GY10621]|uniref:TM0106 family RecB-like putative nuclease n=1 Tax=Flavimobilis rhizosphaerae TaxID=2775421 RepID=A0ABR9DP64_9MICO|nr:bifunctional RecB family nuclease/DEAD/DEAH box helicase [Flavimobilis rhizosphaerae]MBD9698739.1 TM0106 family RecB-like putative nuclease [Flavimobilis rhizosphaerae]
MRILDDALVLSASDVTLGATCELALCDLLDRRLGRAPALPDAEPADPDVMLARAAALGEAHEQRHLARLRSEHGAYDAATGRGVVELPGTPGRTAAELRSRREASFAALTGGADVVFQAEMFDGTFSGRADFLLASPDGWVVVDTKLARRAKVTAVLQLAAYAHALRTAGVRVAPEAVLLLGDGTESRHRVDDVVPVYLRRRTRVEALLAAHRAGRAAVTWQSPGLTRCGTCDVCEAWVAHERDLLLVAGLRPTQRTRLHAAGITTIDELAATDGPVPGLAAGAVATLRAQARLQVRQSPPDGPGPLLPDGRPAVEAEVFDPAVLAQLPPRSAGDLYFDFEGDPLWVGDEPDDWGLEYLWGMVAEPAADDEAPPFTALWAHDRASEKQVLVDFLELVTARRTQFPDMHVYHYAPYEPAALKRLAGRHGVGEDMLDDLLRAGVLVDLYATVRGALRISQPSYSIKKLEPLYSPESREGVTSGADSIVEYAEACALRDAGDHDAFEHRLEAIAEYNADDCISTRDLRLWLDARAAEHGVVPSGGQVAAHEGAEPVDPTPEALHLAEVEATLLAAAGDDPVHRTADEQALAMLAAGLRFHRREVRPAWWEHFDRLLTPVDEWTSRSVVRPGTYDGVPAVMPEPWVPPEGRKRTSTRQVVLRAELEPGSDVRPGTSLWAVYPPGVDDSFGTAGDGALTWHTKVAVDEVETHGAISTITVTETTKAGVDGWSAAPLALVPAVVDLGKQPAAAILRLADRVVAALGEVGDAPVLPRLAVLDLLRRVPPRLRAGATFPSAAERTDDLVGAITRTVLALDDSYLAVQGPPGTGKTFTGSRVVARLVAEGWKVAVVGQSHAVVENMLAGIVNAGVAREDVGKKNATGDTDEHPWTRLTDAASSSVEAFLADHAGRGCVVGGTQWTFCAEKNVPPGGYDLLVVDEAGQFALAGTLAVASAARNVMLLGDPQQLPQVTQGTHPEPVDTSALGWLMDGHATLPDHLGFFLAESWRMHPAVCGPVSRLSYERRLRSRPGVPEHRELVDTAPGVHLVEVEHAGRATASPEEATAVVDVVRDVVGSTWIPGKDEPGRVATDEDVIVVAAYNAQVQLVREALDRSGFEGTRVGTVDRFQGQEAPVAVVTFATSSAEEAARGMTFLLDRHRVNVAVSRAQHHAVLVRSTHLVDHLPTTPAALADLGAFLGLTDPL